MLWYDAVIVAPARHGKLPTNVASKRTLAGESDEGETREQQQQAEQSKTRRREQKKLLGYHNGVVSPVNLECVKIGLGPSGVSKAGQNPCSGSVPQPPPLL